MMTEFDVSQTILQLHEINPKRRREAAIELGKSGEQKYLDALTIALRQERDDGVCASIILALGALGGIKALEVLRTVALIGDESRTALRKALDHLEKSSASAHWHPGIALPDVRLEVPIGLERPATLLLNKAGWPRIDLEYPGLLKPQGLIPAEHVSPPPRWCYRARVLLCETANVTEGAYASLFEIVASQPPWSRWLHVTGREKFPYRLAIEGRTLDKPEFDRLLQSCRSKLEPAGAEDSPSNYLGEILISFRDNCTKVYFRPSFYSDNRFSYRKRDVAASMNPVVAAALARLAPSDIQGAVIDPVCGSGVPLIERGLFDLHAGPLIGLDISSAAVDASNVNALAAGLSDRTTFLRTDARDASAWQECGLVIANLPYGLRIKITKEELLSLYSGILQRSEEFLTKNGRVIIATAYKDGLERALKTAPKLRVLARYRVETGGLFVQTAVLGRN